MANALLTQCANRDTTVGDIVEALKQYERMLKDPAAVGEDNKLIPISEYRELARIFRRWRNMLRLP